MLNVTVHELIVPLPQNGSVTPGRGLTVWFLIPPVQITVSPLVTVNTLGVNLNEVMATLWVAADASAKPIQRLAPVQNHLESSFLIPQLDFVPCDISSMNSPAAQQKRKYGFARAES